MSLKTAVLSLGFALSAAAAASAAPVTFTWNPAGATPPLTGGSVTADNMTIADYASATINPTSGAFTEVGALKVTQFQLLGSGVTSTGLNSTYGLYVTFSATGSQGGPIPGVGGTTSGPISALTYTLWADPAGQPTFTIGNGAVTVGNNAGAFALGTGSGGGTANDFVTLTNTGSAYIPSAHVVTSFHPAANETGFFVAPSATIALNLEAAFTNTVGTATIVSGTPSFLNINGGGGNIDLLTATPTPEPPATLAMLGLGMLGLGVLRHRRG